MNRKRRSIIGRIIVASVFLSVAICASNAAEKSFPRVDGYRGIWYSNQPSKDAYVYKYSGGLGTYCAKHLPHAQYASAVDKTFFVYGGSKGLDDKKPLLMMVSYFDHKTGTVPKPVVIMEKGTSDAHHNPTICIDDKGYLWIFASAHGGKDGFIWKSSEPYSIDSFEKIMQKEFTYPQPRFIEGFGISFLFTKYTGGREVYFNSSANQFDPEKDLKLAGFGGHYQISGAFKNKRSTAFNWHPPKGGLNARTNLYYMESTDFGKTWQTVDGRALTLPLDSPQNEALVHDYQKDGLLVYMKDLTYDVEGNPIVVYTNSRGYESGPTNGPRTWMAAHWNGQKWLYKKIAVSDHNYDMGSLYVEPNGVWRLIAPTEPGAQKFCTGGDIAVWLSKDQGLSWKKERQITHDEKRNHTYVRRPLDARPDFYAFWADGDALKPSESNLYFCDRDGGKVWMLPREMKGDMEKPILCE